MNLTPTGRAALDRYLASVRISMGSRGDVDVRDIEAGILEHVEAELAVRSIELATSEDIADVLDGLGAPAAFDEGDDGSGLSGAWETSVVAETSTRAALLVPVLVAAGAWLVGSNMPVPGCAALSAAAVLARVLIPVGVAARPEIRALSIVWYVAVAVVAAGLVVAPAVFVWGAAQIGGVLERPLAAHEELTGAGRPLRYWVATAQIAGVATGIWWTLLGLQLRPLRPGLLRLLGPAQRLVPPGSARILIVAGVLLFILSMIGWLI